MSQRNENNPILSYPLLYYYSVNQQVRKSPSQSSVTHSVIEPVSKSASLSVNRSVSQPVCQSANESVS